MYFKRIDYYSHNFILIVIIALFPAWLTLNHLFYTFYTWKKKKKPKQDWHISFTIIILSHYTMKDKTNKSVISYYLGNKYINIWDEFSTCPVIQHTPPPPPPPICFSFEGTLLGPQLHQFGGTWNLFRVQCVALYIIVQ